MSTPERNQKMSIVDWQVAELSQQDIQKLKQFEPQLKDMSGKDVILIAYQKQ
jgi:membrane-bound lytic murein transglycosylase